MSRNPSHCSIHGSLLRLAAVAGLVGACTGLGACSTDISRLEHPSYTVNDAPRPPEPIGRRNAGAPVDQNSGESWPNSGPRNTNEPLTRGPLQPPPGPGGRFAGAAEPQGPQPLNPGRALGPSVPFDAPKAKADQRVAAVGQTVPAAIEAKPAVAAAAGGRAIEVQQGDTLYGLAKRHGVSIAALMEANGLKNPALKPGQKLVLPASPGTKRPIAKQPGQPAPIANAGPAQAVPAAQPATNWDGRHTVKPGESLYGIARTYRIAAAELQRVNGITEVTRLRPGTVLKVPGGAGAATEQAGAQPQQPGQAAIGGQQPMQPPAQSAQQPPRVVQAAPAGPSGGVKIINGQGAEAKPEQHAAIPPQTSNDAAPEKSAEAAKQSTRGAAAGGSAAGTGAAKFRWPARGKVIAEFGKRPDGTHNDGVNISVPAGTDVLAADTGTVAYAGSELKGYGNLILIRHDNGWVSAYAHSEQMLVKRGDTVKRGQPIAKAGKTGTVDQPQIHFELRQGSKPVDPLPHMEKM